MGKRPIKIQLTGCSGVGKTTLAKYIASEYDIPFISGSYSDLVPQTKDEKHADMITKDPKLIYEQDHQVLNLRHKQLRNTFDFVTDRSYIDSIAYLINKLSIHLRGCDIEAFITTCEALLERECTHLIFVPFTTKFLDEWEIKDNKKRVLNSYYQFQISQLIFGILDIFNFKESNIKTWVVGEKSGTITLPMSKKKIEVLILDELDFTKRTKIVKNFLGI